MKTNMLVVPPPRVIEFLGPHGIRDCPEDRDYDVLGRQYQYGTEGHPENGFEVHLSLLSHIVS